MTQRLRNDQLARYGFGPEVMRHTKLCPACDTLVTNGAHTCPTCGRALPTLTLLSWYEQQHPRCAHCRTILREDARFCPHCGKRQAKTRL